jgi:hypothetical protein
MAEQGKRNPEDVAQKIDQLRKRAADGELGDELLEEVAGGVAHTNGDVHTNGSPGGIHTDGVVHTDSGVQSIDA